MGGDYLTDTLCGLELRLSVPSFYQVNHDQAQRLYEKALEYAGLTGRELAVDLYCGAGTITQVLARRARHVIGGEIVPEAIRDAEDSARRNGVGNVEFLCGDASRLAAELRQQGLRPDVICVDPPRKGLAPDVVEAAASMEPECIVYVSCDPATLARDGPASPLWATTPSGPAPWTYSPARRTWRRYVYCPNFKARNISRSK